MPSRAAAVPRPRCPAETARMVSPPHWCRQSPVATRAVSAHQAVAGTSRGTRVPRLKFSLRQSPVSHRRRRQPHRRPDVRAARRLLRRSSPCPDEESVAGGRSGRSKSSCAPLGAGELDAVGSTWRARRSDRRPLARRVLDRDHRRDGPTDDLLRRLLDAVRSVVDRVVNVHDSLREESVARLAAGDELRKTVRRAAEECQPPPQLLSLVDEAAPFETERDQVVVVRPDRPVVVTAGTETDLSVRERADARLGEELIGEEQLDDSSLAIFASVEQSGAQQPAHVRSTRGEWAGRAGRRITVDADRIEIVQP